MGASATGRKQRVARGFLLVVLLLAAAFAAAACGGDDDQQEDATVTPTATATRTSTRSGTPGTTPSPTQAPVTTNVPIELDEFVIRPSVTRSRPGTMIFGINNVGEANHEFVVIRSDLDISELPRRANNQGVDEEKVDIVGRTDVIAPGTSTELQVDLAAGKYVMICNLVVDGTSHYLQGMYNAFTVSPAAPLITPSPSPSP